MPTPEIYVSTDIEADGPIPGPHSMLSFASAAFTADGKQMGSYTANLVTLPGAAGEEKTGGKRGRSRLRGGIRSSWGDGRT